MTKKLGLIVNPLAGIGGSVALKGSDGAETVRRALELGAVPRAPKRVVDALKKVLPLKGDFELLTYGDAMGAEEAADCGLAATIVGRADLGRSTSALDTKKAAQALLDAGVDLILFGGGDGTARDVLDVVGDKSPVLGIPCGVKIHSGVFAVDPGAAGQLAGLFIEGRVRQVAELEVMDIDEDAFRKGEVKARVYGYLRVPRASRLTQGAKGGGHGLNDDVYMRGIAERVVEDMEADTLYLVGSGTTTRAIMEKLRLRNTLLGVDLVKDRELVLNDCTEDQLLEHVDGQPAKVILTPIGGQGYILGRGNQQLSPAVLRKVGPQNITIIATSAKIDSLPNHHMRVDTGDVEMDESLRGPHRVIINYSEIVVLDVV